MVGIISLIGINGLTFIIMFFNITLTTGLINKKNYWKPMLISSSMLLFAVLYGWIYSSINVSQTNNIKIMTGYSTNDAYNTNSGHSERTHWTITANKEYLQKNINLAKQAKVDLLAYPEEAFWIWENELEEFKNECISQCQTNNLYGVIGICISNNNASKDSEITWFKNQSWLISNTGEIKIYQKVHPVFMDEDGMIKGDGSVVYLDTKWGRISTAICLDLEYETYMTRFGRANIDLLISPNWDWNGIQPNHTISNGYRAVENGFNMLRVTEGGYSAAIDNHGNVIYQYFTGFDGKDKNVNHIFSMSTKKAWTLYPYLAYFIDYLYPLSLTGLITYFSIDKFKKNSKNSINK